MGGRDPIQLRGRLRRRWRRWRAAVRHGPGRLQRSPIVFGNAMPKAGSKLLFNVLRGLQDIGPFVDTGLAEIKPFRDDQPTPQAWINGQLAALSPGDIRLGYLPWTAESENLLCRPGRAVYQILRDPRDLIVSQVFYATSMHRGHALHELLSSLPDMESRIGTMIRGIDQGPQRRADIRAIYQRYLPWLSRPDVCRIRFEELVTSPEDVLAALLTYLRSRGFESSESDGDLVPRLRVWMSPSRSETFRKGGVGEWREHFTRRNEQEFAAVAGDLLQVLGYDA
jgi:hypothetical protein